MKKVLLTAVIAGSMVAMFSCSTGKGCPTNGKNIGAERLLSGDAKAIKAAKKAKKFRA